MPRRHAFRQPVDLANLDPVHADEAALKADYADLGVSTGYIGNCERWGDDRLFMVFTSVHQCVNGADSESISVMEVPQAYRRFEPGQLRVYYDGPVPYNHPAVRKILDDRRADVAAGRAYMRRPAQP